MSLQNQDLNAFGRATNCRSVDVVDPPDGRGPLHRAS